MANTHSIDLEKDSSQYLSITDGDQTGLDITSSDISIEFWCKPESQVETTQLINKADVTNARGYSVQLKSSKIRMKVIKNDDTTSLGDSTTTLSNGTWYHIACTYDVSAGQTAIYINGIKETLSADQTANTTGYENNGEPFCIGGWGDATKTFDGLIDDVRVWSDIRTATEIHQYMGVNLAGDEANLVGYWQLDNSLLDKTSNNNDLTNNNSAVFSSDSAFEYDTFWSRAGQNTPVDGRVYETGASWDAAHDATSGTAAEPSTADASIGSSPTTIRRAFFLFDTSPIPAANTISSAVLSVVGGSAAFQNKDDDGDNYLVITTSTPADTDDLVVADYNQCGAVDNPTAQSNTIDLGDMVIDQSTFNDFTFNATGIGNIDKTGISKFGMREGHDVLDHEVADSSYAPIFFADNTDINIRPKLVVVHSLSSIDYPVDATVGTFALTGVNLAVARGWGVVTAVGEYVLTGINIGIGKGITAIMNAGSFVLTGIDIIVTVGTGYIIDLLVGAYTLTGIDILVRRTQTMTATVGEFTLTGIDLIVTKGWGIATTVGEYALTGIDLMVSKAQTMVATVGEFTLTGIDIAMVLGKDLVMGTGNFILSWIPFQIDKEIAQIWTNLTKSVSSFLNSSKSSTDWENLDKG